MRILALETSATYGSVAALEDDRLLGQTELPPPRRSAQTLAPAIAQQIAAVGWQPADVQLVAVAQGPGSFTGLRVGVTTAKTLAYAVGAEILGVDTLEVLAWQAPAEALHIWAVLDAQRQQLYCAAYGREPGGSPVVVLPTRIVDIDRWLAELAPTAAAIGSGLSKLLSRLPAGVWACPVECWIPQAVSVGRLAYRDYLAGRRDDLWKLAPNYYRTSAAEEKRSKKWWP